MVAVWKQLVQTEKDSCSPLLGRFICHAPRPKVNTIVHPTSYPTHIPFVPSESTLPFLRYSNFNILPWKSKVNVMAEVKVWRHNVSVTSYWPASLLFHVNGPSHSWDTAFSKFDLENPRSMAYLKATLVGTTPYQLISLSFDVDKPSHSYLLLLKNLTLKSKVKVMVKVNIESHTMGPTFYWLTSLPFQVYQPSHSWDTAFSEFDLENPRSRSWVKRTLKVTTWVQHYIDSHPFRSMSICHPIPEIQLFF